jgi:glycosyltransferase involved in cell wall biosynthesis
MITAPVRGAGRSWEATARPVRVLWLIKGLDPGGAELLLASLAEVRDRESFEYEAAHLIPWKRAVVGSLQGSGVMVHCLDGPREWHLGWAVRLRRLVLDRGYDVVHIHSPYVAGVARLALRTLPSTTRPRLVYTEHLPWEGYGTPTRLLNRLTFGLDDRQVAVSRTVQRSVPYRRQQRMKVLFHGVRIDHVRRDLPARDEVRAELGVKAGEVLIGTVAHYRRQKAYPVLLRAALPVRFVAVGHGPQEAEIRALHRQLGLGDRFLLTGFRRDATRILAACDIFVLASDNEGLPVALMEALALGIPVVATAVGGVPECVEDGVEGVLVRPGRPRRLAAALARLAADGQTRARMSLAAAQLGRGFSIERTARRLEAIYREATLG